SCNTQSTHGSTWNVNDGNVQSFDVTQNVIVDDTTAPATPVLADVTGQCTATATAPTTTDECAGTITGTTADALTYNTQGTHVIKFGRASCRGRSLNDTQYVI